MVLYRSDSKAMNPRIERARQTLNITIDEVPIRPTFLDRSARERRKFITAVERKVRSSDEYKAYIKYLKENFDMEHCEVLPNVRSGNGKKYSIELHHEPFQLSWITDTVISKRQDLGQSLNQFDIADEIMDIHYKGWVGLIPLSKTIHELVTHDRIMIPLQYIYQSYTKFAEEYDTWIPEYVKDIVIMKIDMSQKTGKIQTDVLCDGTVTYIDVDGFKYPVPPPEWEHALARQRSIEDIPLPDPTPEEMCGYLK